MLKKSVILSSIARILLRAIACTILVLLLNRIVYNSYSDVFNRDLDIEITALGLKNPDATSTNVRISDISVNGTSIDLSEVPLENGWKYLNEDDFLYIYHVHSGAPLHIELKDVKTFEITFVTEIGSGKAKIAINGENWKWLDLYSESKWGIFTCSYDTSIFVHPEQHLSIIAAILGLCLIIQGILEVFLDKALLNGFTKKCRQFLLLCALALLVYFSILIIQYQNMDDLLAFFSRGYINPVNGYLIVFLITSVTYILLGHYWITYGLTALILEITVIISEMKSMVRGTPLLPWDYQTAREAFSVVKNYKFSINGIVIITFLSTICVTLVMFSFRGSISGKRLFSLNKESLFVTLACRALAAASVLGLLVFLCVNSIIYGDVTNEEKYRTYHITEYYDIKSFPVAFVSYIGYMFPEEEPAEYNRTNLTDITQAIIEKTDLKNKDRVLKDPTKDSLPNIIVIMSESFWDINRLKTVSFDKDPLPNYHKLQNESSHGQLFSHVFGGNTVISEYEFLTGMSQEYYPQDFMVYGKSISMLPGSGVSVLESQGYDTLAIHPFIKSNYNRNAAYAALGFDRFLSEDDFSEDAERIRFYISDRAVFNRIEEEYEEHKSVSEAPYFIFTVTMQNHGGYWASSLYEPAQVSFHAEGYEQTTKDCMNDYFAGLHESDEALMDLINYFENEERETIIVMFGDHMSDCGGKSERLLNLQGWKEAGEIEYDYQTHLVPFIVWNNTNKTGKDLGLMQINQLFPSVLDMNDIAMPYFWEYLLQKKDSYLASDDLLMVSTDMSYRSVDEATQGQNEVYAEGKLLQYDFLTGQKYAQKLWQLNSMGFKDEH